MLSNLTGYSRAINFHAIHNWFDERIVGVAVFRSGLFLLAALLIAIIQTNSASAAEYNTVYSVRIGEFAMQTSARIEVVKTPVNESIVQYKSTFLGGTGDINGVRNVVLPTQVRPISFLRNLNSEALTSPSGSPPYLADINRALRFGAKKGSQSSWEFDIPVSVEGLSQDEVPAKFLVEEIAADRYLVKFSTVRSDFKIDGLILRGIESNAAFVVDRKFENFFGSVFSFSGILVGLDGKEKDIRLIRHTSSVDNNGKDINLDPSISALMATMRVVDIPITSKLGPPSILHAFEVDRVTAIALPLDIVGSAIAEGHTNPFPLVLLAAAIAIDGAATLTWNTTIVVMGEAIDVYAGNKKLSDIDLLDVGKRIISDDEATNVFALKDGKVVLKPDASINDLRTKGLFGNLTRAAGWGVEETVVWAGVSKETAEKVGAVVEGTGDLATAIFSFKVENSVSMAHSFWGKMAGQGAATKIRLKSIGDFLHSAGNSGGMVLEQAGKMNRVLAGVIGVISDFSTAITSFTTGKDTGELIVTGAEKVKSQIENKDETGSGSSEQSVEAGNKTSVGGEETDTSTGKQMKNVIKYKCVLSKCE